MDRHVARMDEIKKSYKTMAKILEGKTSLVRSRHRCEDNIQIDLK